MLDKRSLAVDILHESAKLRSKATQLSRAARVLLAKPVGRPKGTKNRRPK